MVYCWKCGTELQENAEFCHKCGASVKQTAAVGGRTGFELLRDDKPAQNHWAKRVIAFLIDAFLVSIVAVIIISLAAVPFLLGAVSTGLPIIFPAWWGFWFGGIIPFIILAYFVFAEWLYSRTLGKQVMGLKVARVDGKPMDFWSALVRNVSKLHIILLILDLAVGLGMHGETSQKFSDRYVGTKVETVTHMTIIA